MNTTSDRNPYQPPKADVTPPPNEFESGEMITGGQTVPAGNGIQWIGEGFRLFGKSPGIWILNVIILIVLVVVLAFIPFIGSIANNLLGPVLFAGMMIGCRSLDAGNALQVEHLFSGFKEKTSQLVLIGVLMLVASIIIFAIIIALGMVILGSGILQAIGDQRAFTTWLFGQGLPMMLVLILLAVALFIPLIMAYWFAPALVVFHGLDAMSAMKNSFLGCLRNILPFLLNGIVLFVLLCVAIIPIGLGLLVIGPVLYATLYASYKDIFLKR